MRRFVWLSVAVILSLPPQIARAQIKLEESWESLFSKGQGLAGMGRLEEALEVMIRARQAAESSGAAAESIAITMNELGAVYHALGRYSDAERVYSTAIRLLRAENVRTNAVISKILDNQASLYMDFGGRFTTAERLRRRALELRISEVGPEGPGVATLLSNLGTVCMALRRFDEAEGLFRRALDLSGKTGNQSAATAANVLQNLAVLYVTQDRYAEAALLVGRAVTSLEREVGDDHPSLIRPLLNLAQVQIRLNRPLVAEAALRRAQRITQTRLGAEHPLMANILLIHESILRRTNRKAEAREAKRRAAALLASNPELKPGSSTIDLSDLLNARGPGGSRDDD